MKDLIIFRGLPGSGKSTLAELLAGHDWPAFSVDDFFTGPDGVYHFDHTRNHLAYAECAAKVENAMKTNVARIFVHNTFTIEWEMEPYFRLASRYGYRVFVSTVENRHGGTNRHGIPHEHIARMAGKYKVVLL